MVWDLSRRGLRISPIRLRGWWLKMVAELSNPRWRTSGSISAGVHVLAIAALVHTWLLWAKSMPPVGSKEGTQRMVLYSPGRSAVLSEAPKRVVIRVKRPPMHVLLVNTKMLEEAAKTPSPVAAHPDGTTGSDSLGNGTVNIARVEAFPALKPDLSKMSIGQTGDVVVDVEIDDIGRVSAAKTRKGMGHGIDEVVIATVEQWTFYPAMKNGRPVSSQQELHFHYDRGQGDQACGWDCLELSGH